MHLLRQFCAAYIQSPANMILMECGKKLQPLPLVWVWKGLQMILVVLKSTFSVDDICSCRTVTYHCDGITDLLFDKFYIFSAILRKLFVVLDSSDIAFPSRKCLINGLGLVEEVSNRELCCYFSVDVIAYAYRNLIEVAEYVKYCESYICCSWSLQPYLLATQSYQPTRLGRPVVAPYSPPSPPRFLSSSASSPKSSDTNAPAPTAEE